MATQNSINQTTAGIVAYNGTGTFSGRTVTGTSNQVSIANGDGTAGNPTVSLTSTIYVSGISFDSGSNTLANYAEGTWVPTIEGSATAGATTYGTQAGFYTRIGNRAFISYVVTCTAATGTGDVETHGLPFTVKNQTGGNATLPVRFGVQQAWPLTYTCGAGTATINTVMISYPMSKTTAATSILQMANNVMNLQGSFNYQI